MVGLIGDGSAMYTIQALWTAAHDAIPCVYVIFNNASYRILKQRTLGAQGLLRRGRPVRGHGPRQPAHRLCRYGQGAGRAGELVEKGVDVGAAVERGLASGGPYLVDVHIDGAFKN